MKLICCLAPLGLMACSAGPFNGHLTTENNENESATNYPPRTLQEETFVLNQSVSYESKRPATVPETRAVMKSGDKLTGAIGNAHFLAIPVSAARGDTTRADVMVYDARKHAVVGNTVYRIGYTPPAGQSLSLDGTTAIFEMP
ncbi:MAG: hypothetical protein JO271_09325 [Verrucomicrobia bacterium]|nr:hypothetical protein [Verrucomicrobiota bacterium]